MKAVSPCNLRLEQRGGNASKRGDQGHKPDQFVIATAKIRDWAQREAAPERFIYRTAPGCAQQSAAGSSSGPDALCLRPESR